MIQKQASDYVVAIYCRLSKDDGLDGDSSSIQNQKETLIKYCNDNNYLVGGIYCDDGYSGTNFNRPDFIRMIDDIKRGKINCVITKDLSRLGRNYIQVGYYQEEFFPSHNVRYIAINDNVDSNNDNNDFVGVFKNVINEYYAKDVSKKIKFTVLAFLDNLLGIRETANYTFDRDYDIKLFDNPNKMREALREKNKLNNKARMVAGYCYNWISKNDRTQYDINLEDGFKAQWNFNNTTTWAIDEESFEQVGCIHTSQGLEFEYVGVIIGNDLVYKNNKVTPDYTKRAKTDTSLKGIKTTKNYAIADKIIRNTYKTLLSRGQKGCYIYCEDKELLKHMADMLKIEIIK